ncbi:MAG: pyruvate,water dikinase [Saprospiraceae bacterium]
MVLTSVWGLGENVAKGRIQPDEFIVFIPMLQKDKRSIISRKLGKKQTMLVYAQKHVSAKTTRDIPKPTELQQQITLKAWEIETLDCWAVMIEEHYKMPMDIE